MSIKRTKVRLNDIKVGRVFYTAHPVYGIETWTCKSKPYMINGIGLFVDYLNEGYTYVGNRSVRDSGINGYYNGRRTFRKLKQAQAWAKSWINDPEFIKQHQEHEDFCKDMDFMYQQMDFMHDDVILCQSSIDYNY